MTCDRIHLVPAYHDGEPAGGAAEARAFEVHLAACPACQAELASLRRVSARVRSARLAVPPPGSLQQWVGDAPRLIVERSVRRLTGWMTAAAAAVLVTATLSLMMRQAQATPVLNAWELAMVSADGPTTPESLRLAQWMAADLSAGTPEGVSP